MLLELKVCNINELMNTDNPEDVRFEFIGLTFTEAGLYHIIQELDIRNTSDIGILEYQSECLNIDVCGDDDIIQLNEMIKYIEEELNDAENVLDKLDEINEDLDSGILDMWNF